MEHPLFTALQKALRDCDEHSAQHGGLCNDELFAIMQDAHAKWAAAGKPVYSE